MTKEQEFCAEAVNECACLGFAKASRSVTQFFNAELQPSGLRSTQFALLAMVHAEEPATLARLADGMVVDRSTLSRNVKPLEAAGYVKAQRHKDRRGKLLSLTAKGRRKLVQTVPLWERAQQRFVEQLGTGRWSALKKGLRAAVEAKRTI